MCCYFCDFSGDFAKGSKIYARTNHGCRTQLKFLTKHSFVAVTSWNFQFEGV